MLELLKPKVKLSPSLLNFLNNSIKEMLMKESQGRGLLKSKDYQKKFRSSRRKQNNSGLLDIQGDSLMMATGDITETGCSRTFGKIVIIKWT